MKREIENYPAMAIGFLPDERRSQRELSLEILRIMRNNQMRRIEQPQIFFDFRIYLLIFFMKIMIDFYGGL